MGGARRDFFRHPPRRTSKLTPSSAARGDAGTADVRSWRCRSFASLQVAGGHQAEDSSRDLMWYCATSAYVCVCVSVFGAASQWAGIPLIPPSYTLPGTGS